MSSHAVEAGGAAVMMSNEFAIVRGVLAVPQAGVAVVALAIEGGIEAFAHQTLLHGRIPIIVERGRFFNRPTHRAVVHDKISYSFPSSDHTLLTRWPPTY